MPNVETEEGFAAVSSNTTGFIYAAGYTSRRYDVFSCNGWDFAEPKWGNKSVAFVAKLESDLSILNYRG